RLRDRRPGQPDRDLGQLRQPRQGSKNLTRADLRLRAAELIHRRHSGAMRSIEQWCAIARLRVSRFRVWSFGPSRNDELDCFEASLLAITEEHGPYTSLGCSTATISPTLIVPGAMTSA